MAARSIWTGTLSMGLVNVGVKAFKATDDPNSEVSMRMLHKTCSTPINQKTICYHCNGAEVPAADIVKGFATENGFVLFTQEELDAIKPETANAMVIETFVALDSIDPLYISTSYFLAPEKGQQEAYALLVATMTTKKKAAQTRLAIYGREHIAIIRPSGSGLILQLMRSKNEVRDMSTLPTYVADGAVTLKPEMLKLAAQIVDTYTGVVDFTEYEDGYVANVKMLVTSKIAGTVPNLPAGSVKTVSNVDLMAALKQSLDAAAVPAPPKRRTVVVKAVKEPKAKKAKAS